jgi:hypothetical protein
VALGDETQMKQRRKIEEINKMDMRKYGGSRYLKVADLRDRPKQKRIAAVNEGQFGRPDLVFEDGTKFSVNVTNVEVLFESYGYQDQDWIGHLIELYVGKVRYEGNDVDAVLVRPVSLPEGHDAEKPAEPPKKKAPDKPPEVRNDFDDEIPF